MKYTLFVLVCLLSCCLLSSSLMAETVGWRHDNSGSFTVEKAPLKWSDTDNVVWRKEMPNWSNTSPVIVGDAIITCAEPATLICIDKTSGEIRWQHANHYTDLASPEVAEKAKASLTKAAPVLAELQQVKNEMRKISRKLRRDRENKDLIQQMEDLKSKGKELQDTLDADPLIAQFNKPNTHNSNGYCSYIPQCDGKHIYAAFGIGTLACYDMQGNRKWGIIGDKPDAKFGGSTSPILSKQYIIVGFKDYVAYDKETGKEAWRLGNQAQSYGTPILISIADQEVMITPQGDAVNCADGSIIAKGIFTKTPYNAPIFHDGILYVVGGNQEECKAVKVPADISGEFKTLWTTKVANDRYYSSPLLHEGILYVLHRSGQFTALNASDGSILKSIAVKGVKRISVYTSPTYAAGHIYIGDEAGLVVVFKASADLEEVARNNMEGTRCNPYFENSLMYLRTNKHVLCVQAE